MSRLIQTVLFGLVLPAVITGLVFALAGSLDEGLPLIADMFAAGADRAELLAILLEVAGSQMLQSFLFHSIVAAPALAVIGPIAYALTRRPTSLMATGFLTGMAWGTLVDWYDSFFTGPGVEWDWPLGGGVYGLAVALLAVILLKRRNLL